MRIAPWAHAVLGQRKEGARSEHPAGLGEEPASIGDVHGDVQRIRAVEAGVPVGQRLPVAEQHQHPVFHVQQGREPVGGLDEGLRDVQPADPAVEPLREVAGRAAQAATDVEDVAARPDRQPVGELDRRREAPGVVVIDRRPVVVKGIMTVDDAMRCVDAGVAGIAVSNHGGRRQDHTPGTAEVLPAIADKVKGKVPILTDGCVQTGTDILKYLALGADVVMVGRHLLRAAYGAGVEGVALFMNRLQDELQRAMVLTGVPSVAKINRSILA